MPPFTSKFGADLLMKLDRIKNYLAASKEEREHLGHCPACGSNIKDRQITIYQGLIRDLYKVFCFLKRNYKYEFNIKEVKEFLGKNEYARFGDLVRFGGIVYKPQGSIKGEFGMNMPRAEAFFKGEYRIPLQITINQITNDVMETTYAYIKDFPELHEMLTADGLYNPNTKL